MKTKIMKLSILMTLFLMVGCTGSLSGVGSGSANTDGDAATASFSIRAVTSTSSAAAVKNIRASQENEIESSADDSLETTDQSSGVVTITSARINIDHIDLKLPETLDCQSLDFDLTDGTCDDDSSVLAATAKSSEADELETEESDSSEDSNSVDEKITLAGPFVYDMLLGTSNPSLTNITIPSGEYREVALMVSPLDPSSTLVDSTDDLLGNSVVIEGSYDDSVSIRNFRFIMNVDEEIEFESTGFIINESSALNSIVVTMNVNDWFANVDLGACLDSGSPEEEGDGTLVITESTGGECDFLDDVKQNVDDSGEVDTEDSESLND